MGLVGKYVSYVRDIRRYSARTVQIYSEVLERFVHVICDGASSETVSDLELASALVHSEIRRYEVYLLDDCAMNPRTVNLHLSVLSGFCRYLMKEGVLNSNPVRLVPRPKTEKRLPVFYKEDAMGRYFRETDVYASREMLDIFAECHDSEHGKELYSKRLARVIISCLYCLGLRRSELIGLDISDVDFGRKVVRVVGKGDKMREIPMIVSLCEEISLYLEAVGTMVGGKRSVKDPLLVTYSGRRLYPVYVDRVVKSELGDMPGITGRKSPHVLRHSIATGLLDGGTDLNSIKELLGHSSLAATQVYTHSSIARLRHIYESAHPRAKNGGKNGH